MGLIDQLIRQLISANEKAEKYLFYYLTLINLLRIVVVASVLFSEALSDSQSESISASTNQMSDQS